MLENSKLVLSSTNDLLNYFGKVSSVPCSFPSNKTLARELNVSTTTIRKITAILCEKGIARKDGPNKILLRQPKRSDYFNSDELENSKVDIIEKIVLQKISSYELKPGDRFSELKLSRSLKSNTVVLREALLKIAQSGIIKKHPRQKWEVVKFSQEMIEEISAIRELYESYALQTVKNLSEADPIWKFLDELKNNHLEFLKKTYISLEDLVEIERSFHYTLIRACQNRFVENSYSSVFTLIHYHLWQIEYDRPKIDKVIKQHIDILEALLQKDFTRAMNEMKIHLQHAKQSMKLVNYELQEMKSRDSHNFSP